MKAKTRVKRIKKWLKNPSSSNCPFMSKPKLISHQIKRGHCNFCEGLFNYEKDTRCPCSYFGEELVGKRAQQFVDSWNKLHEKGE